MVTTVISVEEELLSVEWDVVEAFGVSVEDEESVVEVTEVVEEDEVEEVVVSEVEDSSDVCDSDELEDDDDDDLVDEVDVVGDSDSVVLLSTSSSESSVYTEKYWLPPQFSRPYPAHLTLQLESLTEVRSEISSASPQKHPLPLTKAARELPEQAFSQ